MRLLEVFFPRSDRNKWRFPWKVMEIEVGRPTDVLGHSGDDHRGRAFFGRALDRGAALRRREACLAYSGDTEWVEALVSVADGADLFIVECYGYAGRVHGHLSWEISRRGCATCARGRS